MYKTPPGVTTAVSSNGVSQQGAQAAHMRAPPTQISGQAVQTRTGAVQSRIHRTQRGTRTALGLNAYLATQRQQHTNRIAHQANREGRSRAQQTREQHLGALCTQRKRAADPWSTPREAPPEVLFEESTPQVKRLLSKSQQCLPTCQRLDWHQSSFSPERSQVVDSYRPASRTLLVDTYRPNPLRQAIDRYRPASSGANTSPFISLQALGSCPSEASADGILPDVFVPVVYTPPTAYAPFVLPQTLERKDRRIVGVASSAKNDEYGFDPYLMYDPSSFC